MILLPILILPSVLQGMPLPPEAACLFKIFSDPNESGQSRCLVSEGQFYPDGKVIVKDKLPSFNTFLSSHPLVTPMESGGLSPALNSYTPLQNQPDNSFATGGPTWDFQIRSIQIKPYVVVHVETADGSIVPFYGKDWNPSSLKSKLSGNLGSAKSIRLNTYVDKDAVVMKQIQEQCQISGFFPSQFSQGSPHQEECVPTDGSQSSRQYHGFRVPYDVDAELVLSNGQQIQLKGDTSPEYKVDANTDLVKAVVKSVRRVRDGTCVLVFLQEFTNSNNNGQFRFLNPDCIRLGQVASRSTAYGTSSFPVRSFGVDKGYRASIQFSDGTPSLSVNGDEWNLEKSSWSPSRRIASFAVDRGATVHAPVPSGPNMLPLPPLTPPPPAAHRFIPPNVLVPPLVPSPPAPPVAVAPFPPSPTVSAAPFPPAPSQSVTTTSSTPTSSPTSSAQTIPNPLPDNNTPNMYMGPLWTAYRAQRTSPWSRVNSPGADTVPNEAWYRNGINAPMGFQSQIQMTPFSVGSPSVLGQGYTFSQPSIGLAVSQSPQISFAVPSTNVIQQYPPVYLPQIPVPGFANPGTNMFIPQQYPS